MIDKFYRVVKDNFLWGEGAIVKNNGERGGNVSQDPIWDKIEDCTEYISASIIETSPEYFERMYPCNLLTKIVHKTKEQAKEFAKKEFQS